MTESLAAYLPADRLRALAGGVALPATAAGAALFADIAGFTPLAEALVRLLGPRRGAEELTRQLNLVNDALVAHVHRFGGSVVGFSGDAITCWFAEALERWSVETGDPPGALPLQRSNASARALACAVALHGAVAPYAAARLPTGGTVTLALKVAVACGRARRFVVGDPDIQLIDALAGPAVDRVAAAEALAHRAEVLLSPECLPALGERALVVEWRGAAAEGDGPRFPVVGGLLDSVPELPWPPLAPGAVPVAELRRWLLPPVAAHLLAGQGELLAELRPAAALMLRFGGLDFAADAAGERLDAYVRWVQRVLARYGGALIQLSVGDKGSYLYGAFGAPVAHEDDARRAVAAALELRAPPPDLGFITSTQIGLAQGLMRAGAYGSAARRTYGVVGDAANLAARLMLRAGAGEVLADDRARQAAGAAFGWKLLPAVILKGKRDPEPVARLLGERLAPLRAPERHGPLVGRADELAALLAWAAPLRDGAPAGLACVYGEAGIGKSRLAEELQRRVALTWLACPSDPLLRRPLQPVRAGLRPLLAPEGLPDGERQAHFDAALDDLLGALDGSHAPQLARDLRRGRAHLAALLDLPGATTAADDRFDATLAAVVALLRAASLRRPVLLHLEDALWLDDETRALLRALASGGAGLPLALLVTSRLADDGRPPDLGLPADAARLTLRLGALSPAGVRALAQQVLGRPVEGQAAALLVARTDGNPLFVEQLALDLRERGALISGTGDVPASIAAVLLARLDRLPPQLRALVQAAAVLGQEFEPRVLAALAPEALELPAALARLAGEAFLDQAGEGRYRFRHALLRDAAYGMQLHARLRELHGRAGEVIEQVYGDAVGPYAAALAHHFRQAQDPERERRYAELLGEQSFNISAFGEALACFERCLALVPADAASPALRSERARLLARVGHARLRLGRPDAAQRLFEQSLALAEEASDDVVAAPAAYELGGLAERREDYDAARAHFERACAHYRAADNPAGEARALNRLGALAIALGDADGALAFYEQALTIGRRARRGT